MKICIFGNKSTTKTLIENLLNNQISVDYLITLDNAVAERVQISGGDKSLITFAKENNIGVYATKSYSLRDEKDAQFFLSEKFDLGLCTGWQRLIPDNVLQTFKFGIYGWHGSGFEFPNGRGRSPLNWSIRLGLKEIHHNCFKYADGADSGEVYETKVIPIEESDYIKDLQAKAVQHILESSKRLVSDITNGTLSLTSQPPHPFVTFPSLNEKSGEIYQGLMTCKQALQIIRSCSRPFPGAYVESNSTRYRLWEASYCDEQKSISFEGLSVCIYDNTLFVKLKDGVIKSVDFHEVAVEI